MEPSTSTSTRSARAATWASWVTMTRVVPEACTWPSRSRICSAVAELRAPVGSSAKTIPGSLMSARQMPARCSWPPETSVTPLAACSEIPMRSMSLRPRAVISGRGRSPAR